MTDISAQLLAQVMDARSQKMPLKIIGGNSKAGMLARKVTGTPLNMAAHQGIVSYDPTELVLTVRAGTTLDEIEAVLEEQGQMLPFEPPHLGDGATIGGTLACNLSGPVRPYTGSIRDMALGVLLINGRAQHLRFGGEVIKNVAGYDVTRLQAGALGSLGVLTEVSLKLLPRTQQSMTLTFELPQNEAIKKITALTNSAQAVSGAAWSEGVLYMRLSGTSQGVEATHKLWGGETLASDSSFWSDLREQRLTFFSGDEPLWRFSIKPTAPALLDPNDMLVDWGGAQRWLRGDHELADLEKLAIKASGHVTMFKGGDRQKELRPALSNTHKKIHKRLKQAFDPDNILNPGSLYGWM
ncbi:MAG: glycolate oxidase subunit GlcE [bacterium]|nr:glycolate oxidase subunit GlcE [bacterium]